MAKYKTYLLGLVFIIAIIVIVISWAKNRQGASSREKIGAQTLKLVYTTGEVEAKFTGMDWKKIKIKTTLQEGDVLRTPAACRAELQFEDKSVLRLDENTEVELIAVSADKILLNQKSGQTFHRGNHPGGKYQIEHAGAVFSAVGTDFFVSVLETAEVPKIQIQVSDGAILVSGDFSGKVLPEKEIKSPYQAFIDPSKVGEEIIAVSKINTNELKTAWYRFNRERDLKAGMDAGILSDANIAYLEIDEPKSGAIVDAQKVRLTGKANIDAKVFVDGKEIENNSGNFTTILELKEGNNYFEVSTQFEGSEKTSQTLAIKYEPAEQKEGKIPVTAITLAGESKDGGVYLNWSKYGGPDFGYYKIVRKEAEIAGEDPNDGLIQAYSEVDKLSWTDSKAVKGKKYFYRVYVVRKNDPNQVLAFSNVVPMLDSRGQ